MAEPSITQSRYIISNGQRWLTNGPFLARTAALSLSPRRHLSTSPKSSHGASKKERVVVLGSGWAGYALARSLSPSKSSRIVISPRSHFVFTPLLASTAVGTLEFRAVLEPTRRLGLDEFHQGWASDIDFQRKVIHVEANTGDGLTAKPGEKAHSGVDVHGKTFDVPYDKLIIAVGCYSQTFGIEGVREHACFLRDVGDARNIRLRVLQAFERAALPTTSEAEKSQILHFAVVGGGPTGIEFAAELHDLVHEDLKKLYPSLMQHVSITVYDVAPKVLPMFDQKLANYASDLFKRQGIKIKTEHHLQRLRREGEILKLRIKEEPEEVAAGLVVWSTGLMQNPLVGRLVGQEVGKLGQVMKDAKTGGFVVDSHLRVQVSSQAGSSAASTSIDGKQPEQQPLPGVYAIGDCAVIPEQRLPATAQVASQQAIYLARELNRGEVTEPTKGFRFRDWGTMAYLGSMNAIHQSKSDSLRGTVAWLLWRAAYMTKSMSIRNKIMIPVYWAMTWVFGRDISRF